MQWTDEGIIIGTRKHGETSLILEVMTERRGRHLGLVRGGRSRRQWRVVQAQEPSTWPQGQAVQRGGQPLFSG